MSWDQTARTYVSASSGNVAAATATATMAAPTNGQTNWLLGFEATAAGATAGLAVNLTVTGLAGGTMTYTFVFPAGVAVGALPLVVEFDQPLPASGPNTAIVVSLPSGGAGNTNAAVCLHGFVSYAPNS